MAPDPLQWLCTTWCPLFGGVLQSQVSPALGTVLSLRRVLQGHSAVRDRLNTLEDASHGVNVQDGHVWFWLAVLCQASPEQQPEMGDKAGE